MTTTYRIAEVAQRSGFSPPTERYYENIDLLPPPERTEAGYPVYDNATLDRLGFIARAKQLGCSLEEIAELTKAWETGPYAPVQSRLQAVPSASWPWWWHRRSCGSDDVTANSSAPRRAARSRSNPPAQGPQNHLNGVCPRPHQRCRSV